MLTLYKRSAPDQILLTVVIYHTVSEQHYLLACCSLKVMHLAVKPAVHLLKFFVGQIIQVPVFKAQLAIAILQAAVPLALRHDAAYVHNDGSYGRIVPARQHVVRGTSIYHKAFLGVAIQCTE